MWGGLLGNGPHAEAHNCINSGCLSLRMDDCVLPPSFKIARATLVALMRPTLPVKVAELGVTLKPRCVEALCFLCCGACLPSVFDELLDTNAAEAAWNYCAPVVDYDALRKEISSVFEDRTAKVQAFVARLQKTQRAAEQALDRSMSDACCQAHGCFYIALAGMRRRAQPRAEAAEMSCGI